MGNSVVGFIIGLVIAFSIPLIWFWKPKLLLNEASKPAAPQFFIRNVKILYQSDSDMFPPHWWKAPINAVVTNLDESEFERTTTILRDGIQKYPANMRLHLNEVYVLKRLQLYSTPFGGTYTAPVRNRIYLTNDGYSKEFIERLFHAELSSVLLKTFPECLDTTRWHGCLPLGFVYNNSRTDEIALLQLGEQLEKSEKFLISKGFLNFYATSSLENDFNSVAKQLFMPTRDFWPTVESSTVIATKVYLTIAFYNRLHPNLDEFYFRGIAKPNGNIKLVV